MKSEMLCLVMGATLAATSCGKDEESPSKAEQVAVEAPAVTPPVPEKTTSERLDELSRQFDEIEPKIASAVLSIPTIERLVEELQPLNERASQLRKEVEPSGDMELRNRAVKLASRGLDLTGRLVGAKSSLGCGAKESADQVAECIGFRRELDRQSRWPDYVRLCQEAVETDLSIATPMIAGEPACQVMAPSDQPLLEAIYDGSAALAGIERKKWLSQQEKAAVDAWRAFGDSEEAKAYWRAVADALAARCASVEDGDLDAGAVIEVADLLAALGGVGALRRFPTTSYRKLLKDSEREKGKVLEVRAKVLSISRDGDYYRGQLIDSDLSSYMFVTRGETDDIYEDSRVRLRGIVTQIEFFETRGGGSSIAPVVVGYLEKK